MNIDFWKNKRVFITGHTGFKGSWLSLWLKSLGAEVTGYSLGPPSSPSLFEESKIENSMHSITGNLIDGERLLNAIVASSANIVFHMAAQSLVKKSYNNPVETYTTNVIGTVNLLEAVRNAKGIKAVVNVTTDKCYENREWEWGYREIEAMGGNDPYSSSKGCSELVSAAYRYSYFNSLNYSNHGVALATARAGNVIGGGDWAQDRLIPDILKAFTQGKIVYIRNPDAVRPWQHVLEPLRGYLTLAERLYTDGSNFAEAWNFGPNQSDVRSVSWIVKNMTEMWAAKADWKIDTSEGPHEANILKLDISKAQKRLDWQPILELEKALELIIDWTKEWQQGADMREFSLQQIKEYEKIMENHIK